MQNKKMRWAGADLGPLAYESSLSVIWRVSWRNAVGGAKLKKILDGKTVQLFGNSFLRPHWLVDNKLAKQLGWEFPSPEESLALETFELIESYFFCQELRICSLCLEYGYHSFWHQFQLLHTCPLHDCVLRNSCSTCGSLLPEYRFSKELTDTAYKCTHCKGNISGAETSLAGHLEFREFVNNIHEAFSPLSKWCQTTATKANSIRGILQERNFSTTQLALWCQPAHFFQNIVMSETTDSCRFGSPSRQPITVLSWRIRMQNVSAYRNYPSHYLNALRRKRTRSVYLTTIYMVRKWLLTRFGDDRGPCSRVFEPENHVVRVDEWPSELLAYHLIRYVFESQYQHSLLQWPKVIGLQFDFRSTATLYTYQHREPRQAWRAIFLGVFAGLFWTIERARKSGFLSLRNLTVQLDASVAKTLFLQGDLSLCGEVFFPTVPGMPLGFSFNKNRQFEKGIVHQDLQNSESEADFSWPL